MLKLNTKRTSIVLTLLALATSNSVYAACQNITDTNEDGLDDFFVSPDADISESTVIDCSAHNIAGTTILSKTTNIANEVTVKNRAIISTATISNSSIGANSKIRGYTDYYGDAASVPVLDNVVVGSRALINAFDDLGEVSITDSTIGAGAYLRLNEMTDTKIGNWAVIAKDVTFENADQRTGDFVRQIGNYTKIESDTTIGTNVKLGNHGYIYGLNSVIGSNTTVGNNFKFNGTTIISDSETVIGNNFIGGGSINIGKAEIASNVHLGNLFTGANNLTIDKGVQTGYSVDVARKVTIGKYTLIGGYVTIGKNVTIGKQVIVQSEVILGDNVVIGNAAIVQYSATVPNDFVIYANTIYPADYL